MTTTPQLGIVIRLDELELLMREYCSQRDNQLRNEDNIRRLYLSGFLLWLQQRQLRQPTNVVKGEFNGGQTEV